MAFGLGQSRSHPRQFLLLRVRSRTPSLCTHTHQRIAYQRFVIGRGSRVRSDITRTITPAECKEGG